jgi:thioredoxin reductase (NADPH)
MGIVAVVVYFMMIGDCGHKEQFKRDASHKSISMTALTGKPNLVPIAIIGSGPAGLSAAMYAGRARHHTVIFDGPLKGGLLTNTTWVDNWPALPHYMGPEIIDKLRGQVESTGVMFLPKTVSSVDFSVWPYTLTTEDGIAFHVLAVVIATGATPRKLGVLGEEKYMGYGVSSCAKCDGPFFKDKEVVVIGGGDSAVEQAIELAPWAKKVTVLIRKNRMRAAQSMQDRLKNYDHVSLRYHVDIQEICGDGEEVTGVKIYNNKTESVEFLPVSGVFLAIGHDPNSALFANSLELEFGGYIRTMNKSQETSVPGVFAAGEVEDNHYRQASVASGNGVKAALDAIEFLSSIGYDLKMADQLKTQLVRKEDFIEAEEADVPLLTDYAEFKEFMKEHPDMLVVVDFFSEDCSSCMTMLPKYAETAYEFKDKAHFFKVDVGAHLELAQEFFVYKVPCILVFKNGNLVSRFASAMSKQELGDFVQKSLEDSIA